MLGKRASYEKWLENYVGSVGRFEGYGEERNIFARPEIEPRFLDFPARSLVATLKEISQL
jgi:hypothetical protein